MADFDKQNRHDLRKIPEITPTLKVATLSRGRTFAMDIRPDHDATESARDFLGVERLSNLRMKGDLTPVGSDDWRFTGRLTADIVQACVATLVPVSQRIDEPVDRRYVPDTGSDAGVETDLDMDAEDDPDTYVDVIAPGTLMLEVLSLAIDPYPRATEADLPTKQAAPPGVEPLNDEDLKPFAGLAALRDKMKKEDN